MHITFLNFVPKTKMSLFLLKHYNFSWFKKLATLRDIANFQSPVHLLVTQSKCRCIREAPCTLQDLLYGILAVSTLHIRITDSTWIGYLNLAVPFPDNLERNERTVLPSSWLQVKYKCYYCRDILRKEYKCSNCVTGFNWNNYFSDI